MGIEVLDHVLPADTRYRQPAAEVPLRSTAAFKRHFIMTGCLRSAETRLPHSAARWPGT